MTLQIIVRCDQCDAAIVSGMSYLWLQQRPTHGVGPPPEMFEFCDWTCLQRFATLHKPVNEEVAHGPEGPA